jgi:hypothetical protein
LPTPLEAPTIDDLQAVLRDKLRVADRRLGRTDCDARHHGESVRCRYANPAGRHPITEQAA